MDKRTCGVPDERWIDLLTGRLLPSEAESLLRHRQTCPACAEVCEQWSGLLGRAAPEYQAAADLQRRRRERLQREARMRGFSRRTARAAANAARRPAGIAAAGCALALLVFAGWLYGNANRGSEAALAPKQYAELHQPEGAQIMSRPDTIVYTMSDGSEEPLEAGFAQAAKETVWINVRTHEVFLLLEGLLPSEDRDVQAWAQSGGSDANLGLLQFHQGQAHLYAAHVRPELWDSLELTIEPKGGSSRPTSPRTAALLQLRNILNR